MNGGSLSILSLSEDDLPRLGTGSVLEEHGTTVESMPEKETEEVGPAGGSSLCIEDQSSLITDSMSVTSADQEKLLLLNRNTDLRKVNKELMKLNEDWDHVYRSTTVSLQQRVEALELENNMLKQLNNRLLLKVDHEQSKREYYEHTLMQELKKNQHLLEYVRVLETRLHHTDKGRDWNLGLETSMGPVTHSPESRPVSDAPSGQILSPNNRRHTLSGLPLSPACSGRSNGAAPHLPKTSLLSSHTPDRGYWSGGTNSHDPFRSLEEQANPHKEVDDLKVQLEALRCQTEIYESDYQTEHKDHKHTQQENKRLRKKKEEMGQQMVLLQEQLKVYEDDFRKERSDKQILQRLLLKKSPAPVKQPVLVHRCNNEQPPVEGDRRRHREQPHPELQQADQRHHPLCPKHCEKRKDDEFL
ncbi:hypothetical protein DPEC_G00021350 [Dallia pectoralis]|uniref:Uncharacterized protein n=1 Tax=Dallia pectoralis TaxID=75939 RepID=A0ACC2HH15_DALPE|nr:hypothetical protein DPEC_G00021350 [Dallia pectoralis]